MLVSEVIVPQMFTAFANDIKYFDNGLHHYQYYCIECNQVFSAAWGRFTGIGYYERGNHFYCPHCGKRHEKNVVVTGRKVQTPNKARLSVKVYDGFVTLEVISKTLEFRDYLRVFEGKFKEIIRFDIKNQTTTLSRYSNGDAIEVFEIGNPYKLELISKSILRYFQSYSLANSLQKNELNKMLRVLREAVQSKLEKHLGHKTPSMYVSPGQYHGAFLLPILNIAYRLRFPGAPNLPVMYREGAETIGRFWGIKMLDNHEFMENVIDLTRQGADYVTVMATVKALPNRPAVRRILGADPFDIGYLTEAFGLCMNYDYAIRLYAAFKRLQSERTPYGNEMLLGFLKEMLPLYSESGITYLVENEKNAQLWDCARLHWQLNDDNRQALKDEKVKLGDLHDWMAKRHRLQNHKNLKFNVPAHIVRRLSMQKDKLKFFLPGESIELLEAGAELHNCVASYGQAMKDNTKWVVLVANNKGKLAACLEVQGKELVQAKVTGNKPVANDAKLNAEVLAWAEEARLGIKTDDVKVPFKTGAPVAMTG